jgi:hypothetical protein
VEEDSKPRGNYKVVVVSVLLLLLASLLFWYYSLSSVKVERVIIKDTLWERTVHPQEYKLIIKHDWHLPAGATVLSSKQEVYQYNTIYRETGREICTTKVEKVPSYKEYSHTNTKVLEDGTVKKQDVYRTVMKDDVKNYCYMEKETHQVPEYRTKYKYQLWTWVDLEVLKTSGQGKNQKPYFAKYREDKEHKISKKVSTYQIKFESKGNKISTYKTTLKLFKRANQNLEKECTVRWSYFELKDLTC